jgi:hypothetical protein
MRSPAPSIVLALTLALSPVAGPARAAGIAAVGLKGGLSASTLHGSLPTDAFVTNGTRYGIAGGVSLAIGLGGWVTLEPEALFVTKGTTLGSIDVTDAFGNPTGTVDVSLAANYLEIPLLVRVRLPSVGPVSPSLLAGPTAGIRLSQKIRVRGQLNTSSDVDALRSADLGLALGTGVELGRGHVRPTVEVRYTLGLTPAGESSYSDDARNGALLVMAGITLRP